MKAQKKYKNFFTSNSAEVELSIKFGSTGLIGHEPLFFETDSWRYFKGPEYSALKILTPGHPGRQANYTIVLNKSGDQGELYFEDLPEK